MQRSDLAEKELRQSLLAYRLLCHDARTQTICRFTSLSRRQIATLRHRWRFKVEDRSRGPSPSSFLPFFRTLAIRIEGAHLAMLCKSQKLLPCDDSERHFYSLTHGERLCNVLDLHTTAFSQPTFTFDQLVLLVRGLSSSVSVTVSSCKTCGRAALVDPLESGRPECIFCHATPYGCAAKTADRRPM